jgi:hypothetical protein
MALNRQNNSSFFNYGGTSQRTTAAARDSTVASAVGAATGSNTKATSAPAKAPAAPAGNNKYTYVGLCGALNQYEQDLVKDKKVQIANKYTVQFIPASLGASKLKLPGGVDKSLTPNQQNRTAQNVVDPNTNSVNTDALNRSITQGTQIVQFIEMTMRNSSYITDQQTHIIDQTTGQTKPSNSTSNNKTTTWFKINLTATPIGTKLDNIRNDYAYSMVYTITPYAINQAQSTYFPQAQFRGCHKVYNYWFTGENTQILNYEQKYKAAYFDVIAGKAPVNNNGSELANQIAQPWTNRRVPTTASGQSDKGAANGANTPASTLADYLYNFADQSEITLKIIGDPAWIQQGEILGIPGGNFNFGGFYPDGTINTDAQQAVFAVNWNAPADYNLETGLVDVNKAATSGLNNNLSTAQSQSSAAYTAMSCKSVFSRGRFEQELKGTLLTNLNQKDLAAAAANGRTTGTSAATGVRDTNIQQGSSDSAVGTVANTPQPTSTDSNPNISNSSTVPQPPAQDPTSSGDIVTTNNTGYYNNAEYDGSADSAPPQQQAAPDDATDN